MPEATGAASDAARSTGRPPRDNLVRAMRGGVGVRNSVRAEGDAEPSANANGMPTMFGHFSTFNDWYEVNSYFEGHFLERVAPGASKKTMREQMPIVLYNHGYDSVCGDKPLGKPAVLREDDTGPYYEVPLLRASYVEDLVPALEAGLLGASFRFSVMREEWVEDPGVSDDNPAGIPERTIKEMRVSEFGPVSFPANASASAGVRSMTDEYLMARYTSEPEGLRSILAYLEQRDARPGTDDDETDTNVADDEVRSEVEEEPPGDKPTVPETTTQRDDAAPSTPLTPLYTGNIAAPGDGPTPLYNGKKKRKGWAL